MKSNNKIRPIYRVEYRNTETGELEACSIFFNFIEDAREYAECFKHVNCTSYINRYYVK